jgi:DNA sulfur modification protein DndD
MPNGTGKTTTLQLLRAALSGADGWATSPDEILRYQKKGGSETGSFQVRLLHNSRPLTVTLEFDFGVGEVRYSTTLPSSGLQTGFHPPRDLRQFFRQSFVRLFVFDGELASQLLDAHHTDASRAIEDLFQLDLFKRIAGHVEAYWERETDGRTAKTEQGMSRRRNALDNLRHRIEQVETAAKGDRTTLASLRKNLDRKTSRYKDDLSKKTSINRRLQEAEASFQRATADVQAVSQRTLQHIRSPHALSASFGAEMISLKDHLDRVKLPESASREFFQELAEEDECVCGRALDSETRAAIVQRASRYLGSDDVALLNTLKSEAAAALGDDPSRSSRILDRLLTEIGEAVETENLTRNERELIEREGVQDDPTLEAAMKELHELESEVRTLSERVEKYDASADSAPDDKTLSLKELRRRLDKAETEYAEVTQTLALKEKRDVLIRLLSKSQERARRALGLQICAEANKRIEVLMPDNDIRIRSVDRSISLEGQRGGSQGETLAVAYAFLATLFDRANFQLPFVVDSPAGAIDLTIRREIGRLVPRLAEQFVAFTISSERQGFVPALEGASPDILFLTLFRKGNADLDARARQELDVEETGDGLLVRGRGFFHSFQLDSEPADAVQAP